MSRYIVALGPYGRFCLNGSILIHRYRSGDIDTIDLNTPMHMLLGCLYDEFQTSDLLEDGDEFALLKTKGNGEVIVIASCEGFHVIPNPELEPDLDEPIERFLA